MYKNQSFMGLLCAGCNLDGRNLGESFETFSQLKKERHTKERETDTTHTHTQTDARAAVGGSLYIHLSMYTKTYSSPNDLPEILQCTWRLKPEVKGIIKIGPALDYHLMCPYFGNALNLGLYPTLFVVGWFPSIWVNLSSPPIATFCSLREDCGYLPIVGYLFVSSIQ